MLLGTHLCRPVRLELGRAGRVVDGHVSIGLDHLTEGPILREVFEKIGFKCICHFNFLPYNTFVNIQGRARVEKSIFRFKVLGVVLMLPTLAISAMARILTVPDEVLTTYIDASRPIYKI